MRRSCVILAICLSAPAASAQGTAIPAAEIWTEVEGIAPPNFLTLAWETTRDRLQGRRPFDEAAEPSAYRQYELDLDRLRSILEPENRFGIQQRSLDPDTLLLPLPRRDGGYVQFAIEPADVLAPELADQFPEIKTYRGIAQETADALRFEITHRGFFAAFDESGNPVLIRPLPRRSRYAVFRQSEESPPPRSFVCDTNSREQSRGRPEPADPVRSDQKLRRYRLAAAATGEYTQAAGGKVEDALAAIATTINRVNSIYERDLSVSLQLVPNTDKIIYTDGAKDPFDNEDTSKLLTQGQTEIDRAIGSSDYDIGHVFSTSDGGEAWLGGVGRDGLKAQGATGSPNPVGDTYDVDYVAHEMGHQFGANHTFNGRAGSCGRNRNPQTAYEPGSGSTILGYAGICESDNLQENSDDYFHVASLREIFSHVRPLRNVGAAAATNNAIPSVSAGPNRAIPAGTPFQLSATATDPDDEFLTYSWEQLDLGPAASLTASDDGNIPLFRSRPPTLSPSRRFPGVMPPTMAGEQIPQANRKMRMAVTVRDNRLGGGAVASDSLLLEIINSAGPFEIVAIEPRGRDELAIEWSVAGTDLPPIGVSEVEISGSLDGALTFPLKFAPRTRNDGSETVRLPTDLERDALIVRVMALDSYFFAMSEPGAVPPGTR